MINLYIDSGEFKTAAGVTDCFVLEFKAGIDVTPWYICPDDVA